MRLHGKSTGRSAGRHKQVALEAQAGKPLKKSLSQHEILSLPLL